MRILSYMSKDYGYTPTSLYSLQLDPDRGMQTLSVPSPHTRTCIINFYYRVRPQCMCWLQRKLTTSVCVCMGTGTFLHFLYIKV